MDQSRYWIQKEGVNNCLNRPLHLLSSFGDSWEEQAFAEDASGALGGCIWPPRSYTCSFCRREFRSAQALGGHMNVHRRDRARLKQVSNDPSSNQVLDQPASTSLDRCVLKNPNHEIPNPNFDFDHHTISSPRPPFTCSFGQLEQQKSSPILSWPKFELPRKRFHIADFGYNQEKGSTTTKVLESSNSINSKKNSHQGIEVHHVASNSNSLIRKRCDQMPILNDNDDRDDSFIFKRRRVDDDDDARSFFPRNSILVNDDKDAKKVVPLEYSPNSTLDNLDLELRLGDNRP